MSETLNVLTQKRVSILRRYFSYVCDATHPYQPQDLKALRHRFATNAGVQKISTDEKWLLKITAALENMAPIESSDDRVSLYYAAQKTFKDNRASFMTLDPDTCFLSLERH